MTHSERIRAATEAVVAAAKAQARKATSVGTHEGIPLGKSSDFVLFCCATHEAVDALLALEAATCGECGGIGGKWVVSVCGDGEMVDRVDCPACHGTGAKPEVTRTHGR